PCHLSGVFDGVRPSTMRTPISGRLRLAESGLLMSVFGFPVCGSFDSFSQTISPHKLLCPQGTMRTCALFSAVYHLPIGSAAKASPHNNNATPTPINVIVVIKFLRIDICPWLSKRKPLALAVPDQGGKLHILLALFQSRPLDQ